MELAVVNEKDAVKTYIASLLFNYHLIEIQPAALYTAYTTCKWLCLPLPLHSAHLSSPVHTPL